MKYLFSVLLMLMLSSCGMTGDLYLSKPYIKEHATKDQPAAPSNSLDLPQSGGSS
tara:strand:+ start:81203 stop:81367 length:165 start_codon:yes stop_codon:yes gene_type:complete